MLAVFTPGGHRVELLHGDRLTMENDRGSLALVLVSGTQRIRVEDVPVRPGHPLRIDVACSHGHAEIPVPVHAGGKKNA